MIRTPDYPWSELVPGAYVEDKDGVPWKLIEEHPAQPGVFRAVNPHGDTAVLQPPGKPVTAWVPSEEEALTHLQRILKARSLEPQIHVSPIPTTNSAGAKARLAGHLKTMHGEYTEPSLPMAELRACHDHAHAAGIFTYPHTHKEN